MNPEDINMIQGVIESEIRKQKSHLPPVSIEYLYDWRTNTSKRNIKVNHSSIHGDFVIDKRTLVRYLGEEETVVVPNGILKIGQWCFADCSHVKQVILPKKLAVIDEHAFECSGIETIIMPDTVNRIGNSAFCSCKQLKKVILPKGLLLIEACVFRSSGIEEIILPETLTKIWSGAFAGMKELRKITLPDSLQIIEDGAFKSCSSLKKLELPAHLVSLGSNTRYGVGYFSCCSGLEEIVLPPGLDIIDCRTFVRCTSKRNSDTGFHS